MNMAYLRSQSWGCAMAKFTAQDRRNAVDQTLASWHIEGFEPDAGYLALVERFVTGELSTDELRRYLDEAEIAISSAA